MAFVSNLALAFQLVVREHGDRTAFYYPESGTRTTYNELSGLVERIARQLVFQGYKSGDVAVIFNDKSPAAFACILACLRLGIIYTNLDHGSPWDRINKILKTCQPSLVINSLFELDHIKNVAKTWKVFEISELLVAVSSGQIDLPPLSSIACSAPSYIMFTSGSTGIPKGAVMSHANLLWFIAWSQDRFGVGPDDILTNLNPIYFDNSVFDFFTAIFTGATLVPLHQSQVRDSRSLVRLVEESRCTIWFSVPSLLVYLLTTRSLSAESLPQIRKFIFGGEAFPKPKLKQLFEMYSHRAELVNVYGPTECTCICSSHTICAEDFEDMQDIASIGPLSQNFGCEILFKDAEREVGELLLLGAQVGLGYYNDEERTCQSFVQNPGHNRYRDIGYRTGDLVRRDEDGRYYFKGRADFQIKHMGYRIELEEIEAALATISGVNECAAIYVRIGEGLGRIEGFVVVEGAVNPQMVIEEVARIVPAYMVPKSITVLPHLPKNANGKIDRQALQQMLSV